MICMQRHKRQQRKEPQFKTPIATRVTVVQVETVQKPLDSVYIRATSREQVAVSYMHVIYKYITITLR